MDSELLSVQDLEQDNRIPGWTVAIMDLDPIKAIKQVRSFPFVIPVPAANLDIVGLQLIRRKELLVFRNCRLLPNVHIRLRSLIRRLPCRGPQNSGRRCANIVRRRIL